MVFGTIFLTVFSYKAGMPLWVIPLFFGIYFLLGTMIARLRAEMGFLCHDFQNGVDPHHMIIDAFGTRRLGAGALTVFTLYMHVTFANRTNLMPQQLEAFKISERRNINPRHIAHRYRNRNTHRGNRNILALVGQLLSKRCRVRLLHGTDHSNGAGSTIDLKAG